MMAIFKVIFRVILFVFNRRQFKAFYSDRRGAVAIQFALLLIPLVGLTGGAIDLANVFRIKDQLRDAADGASVGSIALGSATYTAATNMTSNGPVPGGATVANTLFGANAAIATGVSNLVVTSTVTRSNQSITSSVTYTANVNTYFLGIFSLSQWNIGSSSTATTVLPLYLDFYLMVDVSGSMGLPSTAGEQNRLAAINPDDKSDYPAGCTLACHFAGNSGYTLSRNGGIAANTPVAYCPTAGVTTGPHACIQLRTDAVAAAIQSLLSTANNTETVANQYRIGLYPFIAYLQQFYALTANISQSASNTSSLAYAASQLTTLLDTGANATLGSGGTHFENIFPAMNLLITSVGNGATQSNPFPFVFLITDGSQNYQYQWGGGWWGSNSATTLTPAFCSPLKARGVTIAILYIPYAPIVNPTTFANSEDFYANANIPYIPASLQNCASPNFFFTAASPADITSALNAMFNQAVASVRISN